MNRGFFRSTAVVGATTLLSRITGLAREMVFAAIVPAVMLEVYVLANQIPNLLRRLFAEGAFSQAFVPVVAEYRAKRSTEGRPRAGRFGRRHAGRRPRCHLDPRRPSLRR
jgi:putative peptidoglycan lipid II flippase